jgi:hypothetical protein
MEAASQSQTTGRRRVPASLFHVLSIALALAAGLALRLWFLSNFFEVSGDSLVYGDLAKNLLQHGQYAQTVAGGELHSTLIRLPGYPLFLAGCFHVFGMENYASASWIQIAMDLAGCLLLAGFARRIVPPALEDGAAHCTLWLSALCPFTAIYAAEPLTEAPTLYCLALALWSAAWFRERPGWVGAIWFTFAVTFAALLRPDGALIAVALAPVMVMGALGGGKLEGHASGAKQVAKGFDPSGERRKKSPSGAKARADSVGFMQGLKPPPPSGSGLSAARKGLGDLMRGRLGLKPGPTGRFEQFELVRMALICALLALAPFVAWTWRNWQVFHVFEPLATRMASDPGEDTHPGWERWVRTWSLDFVSTYDVYWNVPLGPLEMSKLPERAFDSEAQHAETAALADDYNSGGHVLTHAIDSRFGQLAAERIAARPLRYYVWLPLGRVADMWLRPRVENLPIDLDWWTYANHNQETRFSWAYAGLNALYLLLAVIGLCLRPRFWGAMLAYVLLRSAMLLSITAPEARYTIECFPILFVLGGIGSWWGLRKIGEFGRRVVRLSSSI